MWLGAAAHRASVLSVLHLRKGPSLSIVAEVTGSAWIVQGSQCYVDPRLIRRVATSEGPPPPLESRP